ncbi:MAG: hypothetical protein A2293_04250 [Elusimicrobia bacterium RIFOXYB2_FULL_49_7]|nr:MAG: hypothetical protein A2293_04250 [Elusimicrobia bacterium RIFOXYB2_FULL_49_7]
MKFYFSRLILSFVLVVFDSFCFSCILDPAETSDINSPFHELPESCECSCHSAPPTQAQIRPISATGHHAGNIDLNPCPAIFSIYSQCPSFSLKKITGNDCLSFHHPAFPNVLRI